MNNVILLGRLTKDVDLRYATSKPDLAIAAFCVAVNRKPIGNETKTDFFNCTAFGKTAENISKFFSKGNRILVRGEVNIDEYDDKDGHKQRATKIVVSDFDFIESKSESKASVPSTSAGEGFMDIPAGLDEELPFS